MDIDKHYEEKDKLIYEGYDYLSVTATAAASNIDPDDRSFREHGGIGVVVAELKAIASEVEGSAFDDSKLFIMLGHCDDMLRGLELMEIIFEKFGAEALMHKLEDLRYEIDRKIENDERIHH